MAPCVTYIMGNLGGAQKRTPPYSSTHAEIRQLKIGSRERMGLGNRAVNMPIPRSLVAGTPLLRLQMLRFKTYFRLLSVAETCSLLP